MGQKADVLLLMAAFPRKMSRNHLMWYVNAVKVALTDFARWFRFKGQSL